MSDEELINDFSNKVNRGEITFDKIRPKLEEQGFEEQRIKQIVRRVDEEVQKALLHGNTSSSAELVIRVGIVLLVLGGVLLLGVVTGLFSVGGQFGGILIFGSLVAGLVMVIVGIRRKKGENRDSASNTPKRKFRIRREDDGP